MFIKEDVAVDITIASILIKKMAEIIWHKTDHLLRPACS